MILVNIRGRIVPSPNQLCDYCTRKQANTQVIVTNQNTARKSMQLVCSECIRAMQSNRLTATPTVEREMML